MVSLRRRSAFPVDSPDHRGRADNSAWAFGGRFRPNLAAVLCDRRHRLGSDWSREVEPYPSRSCRFVRVCENVQANEGCVPSRLDAAHRRHGNHADRCRIRVEFLGSFHARMLPTRRFNVRTKIVCYRRFSRAVLLFTAAATTAPSWAADAVPASQPPKGALEYQAPPRPSDGANMALDRPEAGKRLRPGSGRC